MKKILLDNLRYLGLDISLWSIAIVKTSHELVMQ